ncbi:integrase, catalytic region, zinc finger, CCHC-type containing protein [Tanacetum coccineum]
MSTSKTYQQSLADAGSETRPPMLERGPYQFEMFIPNNSTVSKLQTAKDLQRDALLHYDVELMNLILLSIPNDIYNYVDACTSAKDMWKRVEWEALVSVYNRFAQLMNDLERNDMHFPIATINIKFLNSLQPEWLKYVTQVRLAKRLTVDMFDDLFSYLQQFEKLVNVSRAKKLEKSHVPLALVAHTSSSSRNTSSYYLTHPTYVVDYEDEYQQDDVHTNSEDPLTSAMLLLTRAITQKFSTPTNNRLRNSSNTKNQAIIQGDRMNIQSRNSANAGRNNRRAYVQEEIVEGSNAPNETRNPRVWDSKYFMEQMLLAKQDEAGVILTDEQNDFLFTDASRMEEIKELSANICLMARIQPADNTFDAGPSYDSAFISEIQSSSNTKNKEQMYPTHTKIINSTIGDDQIDSDIIFDSPNGNVNSGNIEKDTHVPDLFQKQNTTLTSQLELYKERVRVLENINGDNNYLNEFLEADKRAKHFSQQAQSQFVRDRDIIRDLEKQRDKLDLDVKDYKRQNEELQKTHSILKRQMSENEDKYHDTVLDLEAKLKKNVDLILKLGNSLQGMFMLGPKPLSVYDQQLKHGLGYPNPYTLKQAISQCPKLYLASSLGNSEISLDVRDTEDTLDDASKKLSAEQKYFPSSFIPSDKNSNATPSIPVSMPKSELCELEKQNDFLKDQLLEVSLKHEVELSVLLNHECVDNSLHAKIEQLKKKSIEIQEGLQAKIKILEKDVQRCEKQSVDFELKLQHEKEKQKWDSSFKNKNTNPLDYSWISKMEKLEEENVSLDFMVQSLIKERDNVKLEYQKLFNSIKKTRSQTQTKMDELIAHVSEKTYAYGAIRAENQNLLITISELKTRLANVEKGKSVNTKFDKTNGSQPLLCVTPLHKHAIQKKTDVQKSEENHVVSKPVTLQTSPTKQRGVNSNKNVIAHGMYKVVTTHESQTNEAKPLSTKSRTSKSYDTTYVVRKTMFSKESALSKSLDTTHIVSKPKIDVGSTSKANDRVSSSNRRNVVQIVLWIVDSGCSKHMTGDRSLLKNFIEKFMGTVRFGNDNFAAITGYGDYIQGNITICHVYYVEGLGHNLFSVGQFCDGDLEVAFRSKTCYVRNLEGDDLLTGGRESNLYTISISDMAASSPVCLMSKATSTKSWLWHRRLSHLNFGTINDLTRLDLVDGLPKFKYGKDHLCSACERGKIKKASHPLKLVPSDHSKLELLHIDLCGPMRVASMNGKKYILMIVDDYSRYTWVYFLHSKDETPEIIKKFIAQAQLNYKAKVCKIRTDNGTEFKNETLKAHYEKLGIIDNFQLLEHLSKIE